MPGAGRRARFYGNVEATWEAIAGHTYYVVVDGYVGAMGLDGHCHSKCYRSKETLYFRPHDPATGRSLAHTSFLLLLKAHSVPQTYVISRPSDFLAWGLIWGDPGRTDQIAQEIWGL